MRVSMWIVVDWAFCYFAMWKKSKTQRTISDETLFRMRFQDLEEDSRRRQSGAWYLRILRKDFLPKFQDCGGLYSRMVGSDPSLQEGHRTTKGPLVPARRISWDRRNPGRRSTKGSLWRNLCLGGKPEAVFQGRIDPFEPGHVLFSGKNEECILPGWAGMFGS